MRYFYKIQRGMICNPGINLRERDIVVMVPLPYKDFRYSFVWDRKLYQTLTFGMRFYNRFPFVEFKLLFMDKF